MKCNFRQEITIHILKFSYSAQNSKSESYSIDKDIISKNFRSKNNFGIFGTFKNKDKKIVNNQLIYEERRD